MAGGTIPRTARARIADPAIVADALGWFSLGLGAIELLAPGRLARLLGTPGRERLLRFYGMREIGAGLGLLRASRQSPWLWARVGGDALDLVTLLAFARTGNRRGIAVATTAVLGVTILDIFSARSLGAGSPTETTVRRSIEIDLSNERLFELCCRPDTLARTVSGSTTVTPEPDGTSQWTVRGPGRRSAHWTMSPVTESGGRLSWTARTGKPLVRSIEASFKPAPADRGTIMSLDLNLAATGPLDRAAISLLDGTAARTILDTVLHRLKSLAETGEIPTTEHQPAARAETH